MDYALLVAMSHILHGLCWNCLVLTLDVGKCFSPQHTGALHEDDIVYDELYIKTQKCRYQFHGAEGGSFMGVTAMIRYDIVKQTVKPPPLFHLL